MSLDRRRAMIDPDDPKISILRQCALVSISRSAFYYQPAGETPLNLALMRLIDEAFLETPRVTARARWPGIFAARAMGWAGCGCAG